MCWLLQDKKSHRQQVQALHQLMYEMRDIILITKISFDKSIIFHTYLVLTNQIIIQLILLNKLDKKQLKFIYQYSETKSYLIIVNTKFQDSVLLNNIQAEIYIHILLDSEQTTASEFQKILQNSSFQKQIELIIINECHILF